jgi:hypothetical protein
MQIVWRRVCNCTEEDSRVTLLYTKQSNLTEYTSINQPTLKIGVHIEEHLRPNPKSLTGG